MRIRSAEPPWKVVRAFDTGDGAALVHLNNVSGGVLSGDDLCLDVEVGAGAEAQLTTTGATRIYRGSGARQRTYARVAGVLEYLPDAVIPFSGSHFEQVAKVDLAEGSGLFWWEVVSPGREASGEVFAYRSLKMETVICAQARPVAVERFEITARPWLGRYTHFASFYICRVAVVDWLGLEARLRECCLRECCGQFHGGNSADAEWGVSTLAAHGLVVRGMASRSRHLFAGLTKLWQIAKWELYGRSARVPRKLY